MELQARPLPLDPATAPGLSERLLRSHHANNYTGAVRRLNAIRAELARTDSAQAPGFTLNGLKREELIATNSMLLHELYFDSIGGDGAAMDPPWEMALQANFVSAAAWREQFAALGKALGGGSGWVLLTFQPREGTLVNQWASDHAHAIAGGVPLLALDMYEHAYHMDYGAAAGEYVDAFMRSIDHRKAYARYQAAVHAASEGMGCSPVDLPGTRLFDVRRAGAFDNATHLIEGAQWRDPARVDEWAATLAPAEDVVVYCVYGHEVCRATALRLRASGINARFLEGGIDRWQKAGGPLRPK